MKLRKTTFALFTWVPVLLGLIAQTARAQTLADRNTAFALDLYQQLRPEPGNLFFSPYSISTALAMTCAGARGQTEKQMAGVLHLGANPHRVHSEFGQLQKDLNKAGEQAGIELSIANGLWAEKTHPFLPDFLKIATGPYQAEVRQANFKRGAEAVREEINHWVAQKTKGKIKDILGRGSVNDLTRLVLADAIYFKGLWAAPFGKQSTKSKPFHLSPVKRIDVPLMHRMDDFKYAEGSDYQALELPYAGGDLAMVILLPRKIDGCGQLEQALTPTMLSDTLGKMKKQEVDVFVPRYKLESAFALNGTLAHMGMPDAFGPAADFSGMDGMTNLYISAVMHKAWGEVNEEGTEAAAGIAVPGVVSAHRPPPPPVFRADHPFIFLIRDTHSGSILFLGRLADPTK